GWEPNVFRPFANSGELKDAIIASRPDYKDSAALVKLTDHLSNNDSLVARTLAPTSYYSVAIKPLKGSLDFLPDFGDNKLVADLLTKTTFKSMEGQVWKTNGKLETYAASTQ